MVPVRKPGRPLSACPHPQDQACGCGSVTAAIPRKQTCHCGSDPPAKGMGSHHASRSSVSSVTDLPSPTKVTFKVQKTTSRPPSSRKQSFDPANFERMDVNQLNVQQFNPPPHMPVPFPNGYVIANHAPVYGYPPQYANMQPQYGLVQMHPPPHMNGPIPHNGTNGYTIAGMLHNGLEHVIESPEATPTTFSSRDSGKFVAEEETTGQMNGEVKMANGGSCCAPKQNGHSQSSSPSSVSEPEEPKVASCCSSKATTQVPKQEPMSTQSTPQIPHKMLPQNGMHFAPVMYPQYGPQTTVFTYPATYGSFQNPLQPSAWRQSIRTNNYSQPPPSLPPGPLPYDAPLIPGTLDTVHTCSCGDGCQCVGCAAHPYNDATQDYVRSAWASMAEQPNGENYTNGHTRPNGHGMGANKPQTMDQAMEQGLETVSSPTANTPSSTTSGNGEEQSLSAADFFFVNYPFSGDGCGGDTQSCPCGDDCECLGCTIHRQPAMPCIGDDTGCPCGDDCQCIGCEIHKNGLVA